MTRAQAKFELYSKLPPGEWQLQTVVDTRAKAMKDAAQWLADNPTHLIRIVKEIYHPLKRAFFPLVIHEECGRQVGAEFREQKRDIACKTSDDLMREAARSAIRNAMSDWLVQKKVTVLEFLHRTDLVLEFKDAGYEMLHAQQKAAVELSERFDADPQYFMRQILKLCQLALEELLADHRAGTFGPVCGEITEFAAGLGSHDRRERHLRAAIALTLADISEPADKLTRLIGFASQLADAPEDLDWALAVVDGFVAENIASAFAVNALAPESSDQLTTLDLLAELVMAKPHGSSAPTALGGPLGSRFFCNDLPESRRALGEYCISALAGLRRQAGISLCEELHRTHQIANRLIACGTEIVDVALIEDMQRKRERALLNETWIDEFIRDPRHCSHAGHGLILLAEAVHSEDGLKSLAGFLRGWLGSVEAERLFTPLNKDLAFARRMALLAAMQRLISASAFDDTDKAQLEFKLAALVSANLDRGAVLARLTSEGSRDIRSAVKLLRMTASGQFPAGDVQMTMARTLAHTISRQMSALSEDDQKEVQYLLSLLSPRTNREENAA